MTDAAIAAECEPARNGPRVLGFFVAAAILLAAALVASIVFGATRIDWRIVLHVLGAHVLPGDLVDGTGIARADDLIVWSVRAPRAFLAAIVGAALSVAGAQMQAIFRNPLAEPGLVGVGAGSALGGVLAFATGASALAAPLLPLFAFGGGMGALVLVYGIATHGGRTPPMTLLLTGVAVGAILGSISSFLISSNLANQQILQQIMFWTMGGLDSRTWLHINLCLPFIAAGLLLGVYFSRDLDLLSQGEETAMALGVNVERVKWAILACGAMLTGAAVAVAGMVGFVGLIVPHVVRLIIGPTHATLIPAVAIAGGVFLTLCDLACRTATAPAEVPLGVVTALCGGPFFLFLLQRHLRNGC